MSDGYPLRGQVRLSDAVGSASSYTVASAPPAGRVWLEDGLLARLGADVGAAVTIGAREFVVDRVLEHRPDQSLGFDTFAPSLMMNLSDLESTELIRPGSRATYAQLFAGDAADVAAFQANGSIRRAGPTGACRRPAAPRNASTDAIESAERFLSLASMIALLLAATAVAVSARRYAAQQVEGVALMKCLGASQALVLAATLIELAIIGVATGIAGSALGYVAQFGLGSLVEDLMELELPAPGLAPGRERHLRRARGARRFRDARDAVAAHRAAAARAAPGCGAEGRADGRVLRGRGRRRARPARVARRHRARCSSCRSSGLAPAPCCSTPRRSCSSGSSGRCAAARASRGVMDSRTSHAAAPTVSRR